MAVALSPAILGLLLTSTAFAEQSSGVWLDVPFVAQEKNGCGAAVIAMVMTYWQREQGKPTDIDAKAIHLELYSEDARGVYASAMERYFRNQGFRTFAFKGAWGDLNSHLQKGRPLIVALRSGRDDLHYVVATGLDSQQNLLLKHDPAGRKLMKQHRAKFESQWRGANNWTLLALPDDSSTMR
jgi:ABC-type bacteriocin/lantibiotic exporter with double-glycine peptidase domain